MFLAQLASLAGWYCHSLTRRKWSGRDYFCDIAHWARSREWSENCMLTSSTMSCFSGSMQLWQQHKAYQRAILFWQVHVSTAENEDMYDARNSADTTSNNNVLSTRGVLLQNGIHHALLDMFSSTVHVPSTEKLQFKCWQAMYMTEFFKCPPHLQLGSVHWIQH